MSLARQRSASADADDAESDGGQGLTRETAFQVLACTRRRYVLHHLLAEDGHATLRDLTMRVAARENDVPVGDITSQQRMRVYTALRQSHLPKMDRAGVVEFDATSGDVTLSDDAADLETYLDATPVDESPWSEYYLGLGALGVALTAAVWVDAFPFTLAPDVAWIGVVSVALLVTAAVHALRSRRT